MRALSAHRGVREVRVFMVEVCGSRPKSVISAIGPDMHSLSEYF